MKTFDSGFICFVFYSVVNYLLMFDILFFRFIICGYFKFFNLWYELNKVCL